MYHKNVFLYNGVVGLDYKYIHYSILSSVMSGMCRCTSCKLYSSLSLIIFYVQQFHIHKIQGLWASAQQVNTFAILGISKCCIIYQHISQQSCQHVLTYSRGEIKHYKSHINIVIKNQVAI